MIRIGTNLLDYLSKNIEIYKSDHPIFPLHIFSAEKHSENHGKFEMNISMNLRTVITDDKYCILYNGFGRFDVLSKNKLYQLKEPIILHKYDGCLGVMYWYNDIPFIASKRSFDSYQAIIGTYLLHSKYLSDGINFHNDKTYLFEIISAETRNIINYGDSSELQLLATYDHKNCKYNITENIKINLHLYSMEEFIKINENNNLEGFVIIVDNVYYKYKLDSYLAQYSNYNNYKNIIIDKTKNNIKLNTAIDEKCELYLDLASKSNKLYNYIYNSIEKYLNCDRKQSLNYLYYRFNYKVAKYIEKNRSILISNKVDEFANSLYGILFMHSQYYDESYYEKNKFVMRIFKKYR